MLSAEVESVLMPCASVVVKETNINCSVISGLQINTHNYIISRNLTSIMSSTEAMSLIFRSHARSVLSNELATMRCLSEKTATEAMTPPWSSDYHSGVVLEMTIF